MNPHHAASIAHRADNIARANRLMVAVHDRAAELDLRRVEAIYRAKKWGDRYDPNRDYAADNRQYADDARAVAATAENVAKLMRGEATRIAAPSPGLNA